MTLSFENKYSENPTILDDVYIEEISYKGKKLLVLAKFLGK